MECLFLKYKFAVFNTPFDISWHFLEKTIKAYIAKNLLFKK